MNIPLHVLPQVYGAKLHRMELSALEEIRLRVGQPLLLSFSNREEKIHPLLRHEDLEETLRRACRQSVYAREQEIRSGFVTLEGGHRMGLCGKGVIRDGAVHAVCELSSLNIRIARAVPSFADGLQGKLTDSTLIIGPPGSGKTTLLRSVIVRLSDEWGQTVAVADERGEIAAVSDGSVQLYAGCRTDVLSLVPKADALMMLLRTMSPQWIAMDEITTGKDLRAMEQACHCGVRMLATAHADNVEDMLCRPLYRQLMNLELFTYVITLKKGRSYEMERIVL